MSNCTPPHPANPTHDFWIRANALDAASRVMSGLASQTNWPGETATRQTLALADKFESYLRNGYNGG